jgi:hypothetical protein
MGIGSMAIEEKDIKLLWGKAAGRCSYPGCQADLAPLLMASGATVPGEMAHVIGRKPGAARSCKTTASDAGWTIGSTQDGKYCN